MNDITGAIGCSRLDRLQDQTNARRAVAAKFDDVIAGIDGLHAPRWTDGAEPVWHLYTARLDENAFSCTRDEFCAALNKEGVPTAVHYPRPLTKQPAFGRFEAPMAVADRLCREVFCLPIHHDLTDEHLDTVARSLEKVANAYASK